MIDKSKLQEDSHINIDFNQSPISIKKTKDGKWMLLVGCTQYATKLNTWEEVILQLSSLFLDPEKFYIENKIELGNRKLKEVDLHVITKHIEDQLNNDQ
jgi:hypothetical protein